MEATTDGKSESREDEFAKRGRVFVIRGCEARGDANDDYLTRFYIARTKWGTLALHYFHRSDNDDHHDHPWNFWTLVLWAGYREHVRIPHDDGTWSEEIRDIRPGHRLFRPAEFQHWVELRRDKQGRERPAVTLVWMGPKLRKWGFWEGPLWTYYRDYFKKKGC